MQLKISMLREYLILGIIDASDTISKFMVKSLLYYTNLLTFVYFGKLCINRDWLVDLGVSVSDC